LTARSKIVAIDEDIQGGQTTNLEYDGSDLISVNTKGKIITYGYDTLGRR